jgi:DNA invertase Pin-like site-specific DNA recombinase
MVLHRCDNPACFNPEHLFIGTQFDNMGDAKKKGRLGGAALIRGERMWTAKLKDNQIPEIRRMLAGGVRPVDIARQFGVAPCSISNLKSGRIWGHIQ